MSLERKIQSYNPTLRNSISGVLGRTTFFALYRPGVGELVRRDSLTKGPSSDEDEQMSSEEIAKIKEIEIFRNIFSECEPFGSVESVDIDENIELIIGTSTAASRHTLLQVPYAEFDRVYREVAQEFYIHPSVGPLILGKNSSPDHPLPPESVPLDSVTWVMKKNKQTGEITTVDINDFASPLCGDENIDQYRLQLSNEKMTEVFEHVVKQIHISSLTHLRLFNEVIVPKLPFLDEKTLADVLQGFLIGYFRGDKIKAFEQFYHSGEGKGPMSNPTFHMRSAVHLMMESLNKTNLLRRDLSLNTIIDMLRNQPDVFSSDIEFIDIQASRGDTYTTGQLLQESIGGDNPTTTIEQLLKQIDPFGTVIHDELSCWLRDAIVEKFQDLSPADISEFRDHSGELARELRSSEGITIVLNTQDMSLEEKIHLVAKSFAHVSEIVGERLTPLWEDVREFVVHKYIFSREERNQHLEDIQKKHDLPDSAIQKIKMIVPTEKQLKIIHSQCESESDKTKIERYLQTFKKYATSISSALTESQEKINSGEATIDDLVDYIMQYQQGQVFDQEGFNTGYNIPGVPGLGVTYHFDTGGNTHVNIGWLLSMKGLAELWTGAMLKRAEGK